MSRKQRENELRSRIERMQRDLVLAERTLAGEEREVATRQLRETIEASLWDLAGCC